MDPDTYCPYNCDAGMNEELITKCACADLTNEVSTFGDCLTPLGVAIVNGKRTQIHTAFPLSGNLILEPAFPVACMKCVLTSEGTLTPCRRVCNGFGVFSPARTRTVQQY